MRSEMIQKIRLIAILASWGMLLPLSLLAQSNQIKSPSDSVAPASPAVPSPSSAQPHVVAQIFGDWIYRCQAPADTANKNQHPVCEIAQQMLLKQGEKLVPIMTLALMAEAPGKPYTATVVAPLGVQLKSALTLSVDGGHTTALDYQFCDTRGCFARSMMSPSFLSQLKHGKQGHIHIVMSNGRGVTLNFVMNGAAEALAAFESGKAPVPVAADSSANTAAASSAQVTKP
ncbi:Hypothetical protein GbCGDNIH7_1665 [Granulibacter bethesdensis]|nr:Hypothetical protein GbCGDNIH7_1665 [Granulibacter bethesdensis]